MTHPREGGRHDGASPSRHQWPGSGFRAGRLEMSASTGGRLLLTTSEVADILRTSRAAIYAMVERGQLPGVTRIGRRILIRRDALLDWINQKHTPSLRE